MSRPNPASRTLLALRIRAARARATVDTSGQRGDIEPPPNDYVRPPPTRPPPTRPPPTRPPPTDPPPTQAWPKIVNVQHTVWGDVKNAANEVYKGVEFGASGPTTGLAHAVLNFPAGMSHHGLVFDNCRVIGLMGDGCNMRWGVRAFDVLGPRFQQTKFEGKLWEHGAYLGAPQGVEFVDVIFDGMRAAGYQEAHRYWGGYTHETIMPEAGKVHSLKTFRRCVFKNLGDPKSERFGAFSLSLHPGEVWLADGTHLPDINADVLVDDCQFIGGNFETLYGGTQLWRSNRSFMVGNRRSFTMLDTVIDCPDPVHGWAGQCHNTPEIVLHRNEIVTGKLEFKNPTRVSLVGNKGNAHVRIGTGPGLGEGLTSVIYEGVVSKDFEWKV